MSSGACKQQQATGTAMQEAVQEVAEVEAEEVAVMTVMKKTRFLTWHRYVRVLVCTQALRYVC